MARGHSQRTAEFIQSVHQVSRETQIPLQEMVILSSGAMYLGAAAVGRECRYPNDADIAVPPSRLHRLPDHFPTARRTEVPEDKHYFYTTQVGSLKVDMGMQWGKRPYEVLRAGAQLTPEGLPFVSLNEVKHFKKTKDRGQKDRDDVRFIDSLLGSFREDTMGLACTAEAIFGHTDASRQAARLLPGTMEAPIPRREGEAAQALGKKGLWLMGVRYGTGVPDYRFLQPHEQNRELTWYNTGRHGKEVAEDALRLAQAMRLGDLACYAFPLGAAWHDVDQTGVLRDPTNRDGSDELRSAQEFVEHALQAGISREVAFLAAYFIQGTQVKTKGTQVVGQFGALLDEHDFPSKEAWLAARIGSNTDLGRLYGDPRPGLGLFAQRQGIKPPDVPDLRNSQIRAKLQEFLIAQHDFLAGHRYSLPVAEQLFGKNRDARVRNVERLIIQGQRDETPDTWQGFMAEAVK